MIYRGGWDERERESVCVRDKERNGLFCSMRYLRHEPVGEDPSAHDDGRPGVVDHGPACARDDTGAEGASKVATFGLHLTVTPPGKRWTGEGKI